ncbi:MAG: tRNA1(Val) (adenine(37)-N6)-methyltransferase [Acutalibacter sp.]|jgi:tRNA1Val (adenine37-N6)-methyltransferase
MDLLKDTHWEPLSGGSRVLVSREHTFGTDAVLLADFSSPRPGERWADLGTGCGVIPLWWRVRTRVGHITGVELQEKAAAQARRSVEENGFEGSVEILQGDARELSLLFPAGSLDGIACNPPYTAPGTGPACPDEARRTARQGDSFTLEDLAAGAEQALRFGGRLCVCLRPQRLGEAIATFQSHRLEPKRLRLCQQRVAKAPFLFLLECRRGGKPGMTVEPVLLLEGEDGRPSQELEAIYGDYRDNPEHQGAR